MANTPRLRVFSNGDGENYAKQLRDSEVAAWLSANPNHTLVR